MPGVDVTTSATERLTLRRFRSDDWPLVQEMDTNPEVMATLGGVRSEIESRGYTDAQVHHWDEHGFGWWLLFEAKSGDFAGRGGLRHVTIEGELCIEVGYALMEPFWGRGLATELAKHATRVGFDILQLERIVAVTLVTNHGSRGVLEKAGYSYVRDVEYKGYEHLLYEQLREDTVNKEE